MGPQVPEIGCLLGHELTLLLQGLLLGQQLDSLFRQSLLLLQGPLESGHLGLLVLQALGQLLLQGLFLACDLEEEEGKSPAERVGGLRGASRGKRRTSEKVVSFRTATEGRVEEDRGQET